VCIDEDFKRFTHFAAVQFKLQRIMGICFKLRYKLPDWCLKNIYIAFVHPYILYGLEVYGNTFVSYFISYHSTKTAKIKKVLFSQQTFKQYQTLPVSNNLSRLTILGSFLMCIDF